MNEIDRYGGGRKGQAQDPCQLAWQVNEIDGYGGGRKGQAQDPCQLAWQVNEIDGYTAKPSIFFTPEASSGGSSPHVTASVAINPLHPRGELGGGESARNRLSSHQSSSPPRRARGGRVRT